MKKYFKFILLGFGFIYFKGYSQSCSSVNLADNPYICGTYGDANGVVGNWDWEVQPDDQDRFCKTWQARTQSNNTLTVMGSPFSNPSNAALVLITQNKDYTRAKGWELLNRDFGCSHQTIYPYFVLYNKYSGLIRVYIYGANSTEYSGVLLQVTANSGATINSKYPATLSGSDVPITAPDKYLSPDQDPQSVLANTMLVVSDPGGTNRWSVSEFNAGFDPFIEDPRYSGSFLGITIYGLDKSELTANITGTSTTSGTPPTPVTNVSYVPKSPVPQTIPSGQKITAEGEKFVKFGKTVTEVRDGINAAATKVFNSIDGSIFDPQFQKTIKGQIKGFAFNVEGLTSSTSDFGKLLGNLGSALGAAGEVLNFVGGVIGLFSGGSGTPAAAPTYTTYNLQLNGSITTKTVLGTFALLVPGTIQTDPINNATYYRCPLGIFNIDETPVLDSVGYERITVYEYRPFPDGTLPSPTYTSTQKENFVSYRLQKNLAVSFNSGAGLELVSAQAAIVGDVLPKSDGTAAYDLLEDYSETRFPYGGLNSYIGMRYSFNYMLPDLQSGTLEVTTYDPDNKLHTFQTPYYDIGCLNGITFNVRAETKVYLRVKAILKKKNDPDNTPIYYIQDYKIKTAEGQMDETLRQNLANWYSYQFPTPYTNSSEIPLYSVVDKVINNTTYNSSTEEIADNSISTENSVVIPAGQSVTFKTGYEIDLEDGFEAEQGSEFDAVLKKSQISLACSAPQIDPFVATQNGGSCYNTAVSALRIATTPEKPETPDGTLKVYPVPTNGKLIIKGIDDTKNAVITILDQSGRTVREIRPASSEAANRLDLNVSTLQNGVYFIKIQTLTQTTTQKIIVIK